LQVDDIRKTRVYQEAREEGREVGREEGREVGREEGREEGKLQERKRILHAIAKLAALRMTPAKIAEILQLDVDVVRKALAKKK
jgi:predicted transposase YdaD